MKRKIAYQEEEKVIVYDAKTKLSSRGTVQEVLGNNTYLVECGKGPQHVSGDVLSRDSATHTDVDRQQTADVEEILEPEEDVSGQSDSSSDEDDDVAAPAVIPDRVRRRRVRAPLLGPVIQQRLRPR